MAGILERISTHDLVGVQYDSPVTEPFLRLAEQSLVGARAAKIYYVYYGRNAWHSTWVTKYTAGCMHGCMESAQAFVESRRVQGSVFCIEELPALVLDGEEMSFIVTQINSENPLKGYSSQAVTNSPPYGATLIKGSQNSYITAGSPLIGSILSFNTTSRFWRSRPPYTNSVILLYSAPSDSLLQLTSTPLKKWRSRSFGGQYKFSWLPCGSRVRASGVLGLHKLACSQSE